jgi:histidyl-tRNA synthetase
MARYQAVRGTFDVLPNEMANWHNLEGTSRDLAHRFGYREIRTPLFEEAELFTRGMGVMSGLIEKELWTFNDKFGQKLALRTDATTGIIRAYQQNKLYNSKLPVKVFYLAPVFLLGKEGEARSRQSHQFGFEAIGSTNPALDAEVIALAAAFCEGIGLTDVSIRMNSLGGKDCRPVYLQKLRDYFGSNSSRLCTTCKRKYKANPDWVLSCEETECKSLSQVAPTIYGMLTNEAKSNFSQLREYLQDMELPVELDPRVVRDSEYYNGTVFQVQSKGKPIGFGGRYDTLIEKLGGKPTPAVGFAFSLESIMDLLDPPTRAESGPNFDVLLRPEGPESAKLLVPLLYTLRQRGVSAELDYGYDNGRRKREDTTGFSYLVTLDESNAFRGTAVLRDLEDSSDERIPVARLRNRVLHVAGVGVEEERDGSKSGRKRLRRGRRRPDEDRTSTEDTRSGTENEKAESRPPRRARAKPRRGREATEAEPRKERQEQEPVAESSNSEAKEAPAREREPRGRRSPRERAPRDSKRPEKRPRPVAPAKEKEPDGGKAIVPVFGLGTGPAPTTAKKVAKTKARKATITTSPPPPASSSGGLNWSIIPGKEGS